MDGCGFVVVPCKFPVVHQLERKSSVGRKPYRYCVFHCCQKRGTNETISNYSRRTFLNSIAWNSIWILSTGWFLDKQPSWATEEKQTVPASIANQVETYKDLVQGYKILRPIGWNEFAGQRNQYDIKWQDIIQPLEMVMIATVDIGKNKSVKELGSPTVRLKLLHIEKKHYPWKKQLGEKLAKNRKMQLVAAVEKESGGVPAYEIELKAEPLHELVLVTAVKNKLFSVTASCSESRWFKREKLLRTVVDSFVPSL